MDTDTLVVLLAAVIGGGGIVGSIAAFRKVKPEKESIIVTAAQGALVVQAGVLDDLREELERLRLQNESLEGRVATLTDELHRETTRLRGERDSLREQNAKLSDRVRQLEARVQELEGTTSPPHAAA